MGGDPGQDGSGIGGGEMTEDTWDTVDKALEALRLQITTALIEEEEDEYYLINKMVACEAVVELFNEYQIALDNAIWESQ